MEKELEALAQASGASQEDISLYMKGFKASLSMPSPVGLCEFPALGPDDFREPAYRSEPEWKCFRP